VKSEYLTKAIAAQRLGLSVRRVLEISNAGKIRHRHIIDPGTQREQMVLLAADVKRMAAAKRGVLAPVGAEVVPHARTEPAPVPAAAAPRLWLTAAEAAEYSGLPASYLIELVQSGLLLARDVGVRPGGKYRIRRVDLDGLAGKLLAPPRATKR